MPDRSFIVQYHGNLTELLSVPHAQGRVECSVMRRGSIKDIIEASGIPHTEIGRIICNRRDVSFAHLPVATEHLHILPFTAETPRNSPTLLRPEPLPGLKFLVDSNVLKLGRNLRLAGFDTIYAKSREEALVVREAYNTSRILLTKNREALKYRLLIFGQLLRSEDHAQQFFEVVERFRLKKALRPMSRCPVCNGILKRIDKNKVLHRLEPLTVRYYNSFTQCITCEKIFWEGSHMQGIQQLLALIHK